MNLIQFFWDSFLVSIIVPLTIILLGVSPLGVTIVFLYRRKRRYQAEMKEPFTRFPLRPPGESLRLQIDYLSERLDETAASLILSNLLAAVILAIVEPAKRLPCGIGLGIVVLIVYVRYLPRLFKLSRRLWDYRLGYKGERVVGEELSQLLAIGFRVFHDVPFGTFNIDHVLVGPPGVYIVETKTRRKPTHFTGREKATVIFDGTHLHFPGWSESRSLEQARRNAQALSAWLTSALGVSTSIPVNAILTLPGWWIERKARGEVNVLNPEEIKRSFPARPAELLSPQQIKQIAHPLAERCQMKNEAGFPDRTD